MDKSTSLQTIPCPYCGDVRYKFWAEELGFHTVRCVQCRFLYVNPRPSLSLISKAVKTGSHGKDAHFLDVTSHRVATKVERYRKIFERFFDDIWKSGRQIAWLDIGAGYGEIMEAVAALAPKGSNIEGLEPMQAKASSARARGLKITEDYLQPTHPKVDFISIVDVFSHIPDFTAFLSEIKAALNPGGEIFIETGNLADMENRSEFSGELGLPDHLAFAGSDHLQGYLQKAGFEIIRIEHIRIDGIIFTAKNFIKKIIGRPAVISFPYTSAYRQILIRAKLSHIPADSHISASKNTA